MMDVVADLHLHSKYSRAVSPQMNLITLEKSGRQKGIQLLGTGDWTHPLWMKEIRSQLIESEEGVYKVKGSTINDQGPSKETRFLLSVEIATIFTQGGKGRRIHNLIFVPSFETAEKVSRELLKRGCNLSSDGRPIIGLSSKHLLELLLEIDERNILIPAHVWTPWFGVYGQKSGFNSLSEAFEELAPFIYGIETGLSSDPLMNWQVEELATRSILSFSDAHSLPKMGREATVFRLENLSYENIRKAIMRPCVLEAENRKLKMEKGQKENLPSIINPLSSNRILYTIEFYPEEGKYHYSGHRNCDITMTPGEQKASNGICPVCGRHVTDGVMRRVMELSKKDLGFKIQDLGREKQDSKEVVWVQDSKNIHPPFVRLVPLIEVIAEAIKSSVGSKKTKNIYDYLCQSVDSELHVLLQADSDLLKKEAGKITTTQNAKRIARGIEKVRQARIVIKPGFDGVYGTVKIWPEDKDVAKDVDEPGKDTAQIGLDI